MMTRHPDPMNLIVTGVGGQGNVLISQILGRALLKQRLPGGCGGDLWAVPARRFRPEPHPLFQGQGLRPPDPGKRRPRGPGIGTHGDPAHPAEIRAGGYSNRGELPAHSTDERHRRRGPVSLRGIVAPSPGVNWPGTSGGWTERTRPKNWETPSWPISFCWDVLVSAGLTPLEPGDVETAMGDVLPAHRLEQNVLAFQKGLKTH